MQSDIEIDKALALAIGWRKTCESTKTFWVVEDSGNRRVFTHKDWNVIGPIAEKYNCFPVEVYVSSGQWFSYVGMHGKSFTADTPQKAIALAVIGTKK